MDTDEYYNIAGGALNSRLFRPVDAYLCGWCAETSLRFIVILRLLFRFR